MKRLTWIVLGIHILLIALLAFISSLVPQKSSPPPLVVKERMLPPPKPKQIAKKTVPQRVSAPKPLPPKKVVKAPPKPAPAPPRKETAKAKKRARLKAAMEATLGQQTKVHANAVEFAAGYEEELTRYLARLVTLPEHGEVEVSLTIQQDGTLSSLRVIGACSSRNRSYVESRLRSVDFPPLGQGEKKARTFSIRLLASSS